MSSTTYYMIYDEENECHHSHGHGYTSLSQLKMYRIFFFLLIVICDIFLHRISIIFRNFQLHIANYEHFVRKTIKETLKMERAERKSLENIQIKLPSAPSTLFDTQQHIRVCMQCMLDATALHRTVQQYYYVLYKPDELIWLPSPPILEKFNKLKFSVLFCSAQHRQNGKFRIFRCRV